MLKEAADGAWRVSLRSLGAVDVCRIAEQRRRRRPPLRRRLHERRPRRGRRAAHPRRAREPRPATEAFSVLALHDGLVVVDKPAAHTSHDVVARHAQALRPAPGRPRGHARSRRHRRAARRARPGDPLMRYLQDDGEVVPRPGRVRRRDRHARRVGRGARTGGDAARARAGRGARRARSSATSSRSRRWCRRSRSRAASSTSSPGRGRRSTGRPGTCAIDALVVEDFVAGAYPEATIRVDCSSGTYVRTLAADLGTALGGCAHLGELRRLRVGSFGLDEAHTLDEIERRSRGASCSRRPPRSATSTEVVVDGEQQRAVAHGATFAAPALLGDTRRARSVLGRRRARRAARGLRTHGARA